MNLIFAGSGEFGVPTLRALLDAGHRVALVVSQPDRPAGRGQVLTPTPIAKLALELSLPLLRTADLNSEPLPPADLLIVIAFGQKLAPQIIGHPRLGAINLHGSRLPRFRGAAPVQAAILAGESSSGNSVIRLAQTMDAGAILAQSEVPIGPLETAGELHDRLANDGVGLVLETVRRLESGTAVEVEQDASRASRAPKMCRQAARIDFSSRAEVVARQIRGMYPWPGCRVAIVDSAGNETSRLTLVRAQPATSDGVTPPSEIDSRGGVACGAGSAIEIVELHPQGKRPMSLAAFRNGHRFDRGMRLVSL